MVLVIIIYTNQGATISAVDQTFKALKAETSKFTDGSELTYLIPEQPEGEKLKPIVKDLPPDATEQEKKISKAVEQIATPVKDVVQYTKDDPVGVVVSGYVIIIDSATQQPMKPYTYDVMIQIECDLVLNDVDGFNYCNTNPLVGRVQTEDAGQDNDGVDKGGYYKYVWHPPNVASSGFYDIVITIVSDQKNQEGRYENYEKSYKIQVL